MCTQRLGDVLIAHKLNVPNQFLHKIDEVGKRTFIVKVQLRINKTKKKNKSTSQLYQFYVAI